MAADTTETTTKKTTVRNLATEINISHDTLIEFLQKKGFTNVKSIMSKVEDDALEIVMKQFGKEKDVTEKRQKKIAAFKEKQVIAKEPVAKEPSKSSKKPGVKKEVPKEKPAQDTTPSDLIPSPISAPPPPPEEDKIIAPEIEMPEIAPAEGGQIPEHEDEHGDDHHRKKRKKKKTTIISTGVPEPQGLRIKGKIDLESLKPKKKAPGQKLELRKATPGGRPNGKVRGGFEIKSKKTIEEEDRAGKKKRGRERSVIDAKEVQETVKRTLSGIEESTAASGRAKMRKQRRRSRAETEERRQVEEESQKKVIQATEFLTANELANLMQVDVGQVITKCIELGLMVSINQRLDKDTIELVAGEFDYTIEFQAEYTTDVLEDTPDAPETLKTRPPVVTIMGHVDHGKTSLLDYIRKSRVVAGESGGITQHIGAYEVSLDSGRQISFLDTPGHEAFTAMRARGAQVTDIVVLVVAADDSVMPQTWEAISHATAASVPIVIAINKIDRPEANPDRIRQQLSDKNILVEEWGGKYGAVEISAKTGLNVDKLLDRVLLEADILDLKANPDRIARGVIVEAEVDRGRGIQATVLVQKGTLRMGDPFIAGVYSGKVRAMFDERGKRLTEAPPSRPVQLLGFDGIPQAGDQFIVVESDSAAKELSLTRQQLKREQSFKQMRSVISLDDISAQIKEGKVRNLRLILKGDVDGSVEAIADSLQRLATSEVKVEIVHRAVGAITENDVRLAAASNAIVIGFHVRPNLDARRIAASEHVDIRLYSVIYDCINEVRAALEGLLAPEEKEEVLGTVTVREIFKVPKLGTIAGSYVQDGKITRNNKVRVVRDGLEVFAGNLTSLRRFKDDVREVDAGYECGIGLENFNDIKVGDTIEAYKMVEVKRKLEIPVMAR